MSSDLLILIIFSVVSCVVFGIALAIALYMFGKDIERITGISIPFVSDTTTTTTTTTTTDTTTTDTTTTSTTGGDRIQPGNYKVTYYHPNWGLYRTQGNVKPFSAKDIPVEYVTEIAHAFVGAKKQGNGHVLELLDPTGDAQNFKEYRDILAKKKIRISLAWGGWNDSFNCSDVVATPESRKMFIDSILNFMKNHPEFDGFLIDWEYPSDNGMNYGRKTTNKVGKRTLPPNAVRKEDGANLLTFVKELRAALDASGRKGFRLGMCGTASPDKIRWPVKEVSDILDEIQIMTYDFCSGSWACNGKSAHHANLRPSKLSQFSAQKAVDAYLEKGVPAHKLMIGVAFYSRGSSGTLGLGKPTTKDSPDASWTCKGCEIGSLDYAHCPPSGSTEYFDDEAYAAYAYDPARKVFTSYDDPRSVRAKCQYVKEKGLKGIIVWDISMDKPITDPKNLTKILYAELES
jgi:chitinase